MNPNNLENLACEMKRLYDEDCRPFAYDDLDTLRTMTKRRLPSLNPDWDAYSSALSGYCSWDRRALNWTLATRQEVAAQAAHSFFEKHPNYRPLEKLISPTLTPTLYADLQLAEQMRTTLLQFIELLEYSQYVTGNSLMKVA